ncbi:MAG: hypothetical protein JWO53_133, partial [Chlamydiia bacterium]|nr:hypothetical protein [Chlamydiia bacterium]
YIQGAFGKQYVKGPDLIKKNRDRLFRGHPNEYDDAFDLESTVSDQERRKKLEELFVDFLVPFCEKALNRKGIIELGDKKQIFLYSTMREQIQSINLTNDFKDHRI